MEPEEWQHFWGELDFGGRLNFLSTTELVRAQQEGKWSETRAMVMAALDHAIALLSAGDSIELLGAKVEGLHYGRELSAMDQVIAIMVVIVVIGLLVDKILFSPIEKFLHRRWGTSQA